MPRSACGCNRKAPYWLRVDSSVGLLPSLGHQMVSRLGSLGVTNLGELILLDVNTLGSELESLQIFPAQLRFWQAEAGLLSSVPDLIGAEAQLLAPIGIENPVALGAEDAETLSRRNKLSGVRVRGRSRCGWPIGPSGLIWSGCRPGFAMDVGR